MSFDNVLTVSGTGVITTDFVTIRHLHWHNPSAADTFVIKDSSGVEIWKDYAVNSQNQIYDNINMPWNGLNCTELGGGTLYIYLA